ncbi:MAG TPA: response regulator [Candidatus Baltobacteraceae bacterium]|jgi:CheY-like chemotaxis protein|nr:response regulator [Candidatus Baltobacteraceae bacterium]
MEKDDKSKVEPEPPLKQTILIVEDEPTLRALVRKVLERVGYEVIEAPSGLAALELWKQKHPHVDLLLTDMVMPDGISGRQLGEKLKSENPKLKVIYTTGYSADMLGNDFDLKEGVNFLQKPYPPQKLVQTVRNGLQSEDKA